jgi:Zn-finger nucleic acid-binding protein
MKMCFNLFKKQEKYNEKILVCPKCDKPMKKINKGDVIIDVCPKCKGMWLDDKEIDKLTKLARGNGNGKKGKN